MEADYSWKESVARVVLALVEATGTVDFTIEQVYAYEAALQARFPQNRHVREKMRQSLQKLVADGLLLRTQRGNYRINQASPELEVTTDTALDETAAIPSNAVQLPDGNPTVKQIERIIRVRLRNTILAIELKKAYNYKCQVCNYAVPLRPPILYAEGHHLRPLGGGHNGPDVPGNIIVLCPNHHKMFDAGAAAIEPDTYHIVHIRTTEFRVGKKLETADWHHLNPDNIVYHYEKIFSWNRRPPLE